MVPRGRGLGSPPGRGAPSSLGKRPHDGSPGSSVHAKMIVKLHVRAEDHYASVDWNEPNRSWKANRGSPNPHWANINETMFALRDAGAAIYLSKTVEPGKTLKENYPRSFGNASGIWQFICAAGAFINLVHTRLKEDNENDIAGFEFILQPIGLGARPQTFTTADELVQAANALPPAEPPPYEEEEENVPEAVAAQLLARMEQLEARVLALEGKGE